MEPKEGAVMDKPYVLSRRERKKLNCKYAILRAARELMQERGLEVPIEQIAQRAEISYPTFYNYFPTKAALCYALYLEELEDIHEFADMELAGVTSAAVRIERLFDALMHDFVRYRYLDLYVAGEVARHTAETGEDEQISVLFQNAIAAGQETGEFRQDIDARRYALLIAGIIFSTMFYSSGQEEYTGMLRILLDGMLARTTTTI